MTDVEKAIALITESDRQSKIMKENPTVFYRADSIEDGKKHMSELCNAYSLAVAALREKAEREANEPLTLDELRECCKVGTSIYVSNINGTPIFKGQISVGAVLDIIPAFGSPTMHIQAIYGRCLTLAEGDYGKTWLAYRYKPKEAGRLDQHFCSNQTQEATP